MLGALLHIAPGVWRVLGRKREEQAGAGRLKEVEGCLAPLYIMPRWVRVWNRDERAGVGRLQEVGG